MGSLIITLSIIQRIILIPAQLFVGIFLLLLNVLVKIITHIDSKIHISKLLKKLFNLVPDYFGEDNYHIKFYITYISLLSLCFIGLFFYWDPLLLIIAYLMRFVWSGIGAEVANHRYFSHRSFKCEPSMEKVLKICSIFSIEGPSIMWVAQHRVHHKFSDTEFDPHPPTKWYSTFSNLKVPENVKPKITPLVVRDLLNDEWHKFIKDNYFTIYWSVLILFSLIDFKLTIYTIILPGLMAMIDSTLVNWLCHTYGNRLYEINDKSTNNYWLNLWAPGGGLHHNHHSNASNYHNEHLWWEFDFFKPIIEYVIATKTFNKNRGINDT